MALAAANSRLLSETAPHKVFPEENPNKEGTDKPAVSFLHVLRGMKDSFGRRIHIHSTSTHSTTVWRIHIRGRMLSTSR